VASTTSCGESLAGDQDGAGSRRKSPSQSLCALMGSTSQARQGNDSRTGSRGRQSPRCGFTHNALCPLPALCVHARFSHQLVFAGLTQNLVLVRSPEHEVLEKKRMERPSNLRGIQTLKPA